MFDLKALAQAALAAWKAQPDEVRNGERPFIMGFNDGFEEAIKQAAVIARRMDPSKDYYGDPPNEAIAEAIESLLT